jgi:hypothetical protein
MGPPCVELHDHQDGGLSANCPRTMTDPTVMRDAALIFSEGNMAGPHFNAFAVHGLHPPTARQRNDPLWCRIFVPSANPAHRLHRHHRGHAVVIPQSLPLRIGRWLHRLQLESRDQATPLAADAVLISVEMPIRDGWLLIVCQSRNPVTAGQNTERHYNFDAQAGEEQNLVTAVTAAAIRAR